MDRRPPDSIEITKVLVRVNDAGQYSEDPTLSRIKVNWPADLVPTNDSWPGVTLPDAGRVVDRTGSIWTMDGAGTVGRDGIQVAWNIAKVTFYAGVIYALYLENWYFWDETAPNNWSPVPGEGDPVPAVKPADGATTPLLE